MTTCPKCGYGKAVQGLNEIWCDNCDAYAAKQETTSTVDELFALRVENYDVDVLRLLKENAEGTKAYISRQEKLRIALDEQHSKRAAFWDAIDSSEIFTLTKEFVTLREILRINYSVDLGGNITTGKIFVQRGRVEICIDTDSVYKQSDAIIDALDALNETDCVYEELVYVTDAVDECIKTLENK